jgi:XTP/dITP diphosphohydrolase
MMQLLFATSNPNKTAEIKRALPDTYHLQSLTDIQLNNIEVDEPYNTLQENAVHKAITYQKLTGISCFSEDTGLEVTALKGAPGVWSARYAGIPASDIKNIEKLLGEMELTADRSARFRTVIALVRNDTYFIFEGICEGHITREPKGQNGFGYDPVFIPEGSDKTFAEMSVEEKNTYSHRKKALTRLIEFLEKEKQL